MAPFWRCRVSFSQLIAARWFPLSQLDDEAAAPLLRSIRRRCRSTDCGELTIAMVSPTSQALRKTRAASARSVLTPSPFPLIKYPSEKQPQGLSLVR